MASAKSVGGFDANFAEPLDKDLECPVCLLALRDPLQVATCGHLFCESCLDEVTQDDKFKCPLDNTESYRKDAFSDLFHQRKVLNLKVRCTNSSKGCTWSGELRQLNGHMSGTGTAQCDFVEVDCQFNVVGCKEKVEKRGMKSHMASHIEHHMLMLLGGFEALKQENEALKQENEEVKAQLRDMSSDKCVFLWKIENWQEKLNVAKQGGITKLYSMSFYTAYPGYKLRIMVYPNGTGIGNGSHVTIALSLTKGKYDHLLSWPFLRPYTLSLVDQQPNGRNSSVEIVPANEDREKMETVFRRPSEDTDNGFGVPRFIAHSHLDSAAFVQEDCIVVKVEVTNV